MASSRARVASSSPESLTAPRRACAERTARTEPTATIVKRPRWSSEPKKWFQPPLASARATDSAATAATARVRSTIASASGATTNAPVTFGSPAIPSTTAMTRSSATASAVQPETGRRRPTDRLRRSRLQADHLQPAGQRLRREGARLVDRRAEELDVLLPLGHPLRAQHPVGDRPDLDERALDRVEVAPVAPGHVAQEARAEGDVAVLVACHVGEPRDERRQRPHPLVVVDDEVLAGQGERALDDHVVQRDRLDQALVVLGLDGQAVDALVQDLVEEHLEVVVEVLGGGLKALAQPLGLVDADLAVEAVEERDVARLVGDLRRQEDPHVLIGDRAHERAQLGGDALLADEEGAQAGHSLEALLGVDALVPVDAVLREVEVLRRPLLALPELVELAVGQQLLARCDGGIAGRLEVGARGE